MLHGLRTGVVGEKLQKVLDCVFLNEYIRTDTIRSTEDVRELVDLRLSCMGNWYGHAAFSHGFYGRGDGGGLRGVEATSLARLIPFAIAGCPILIPDAQKRRQVLSAAWSLLTLVSEFKTEQYYTDAEFGALDERALVAMRGMHTSPTYFCGQTGALPGLGTFSTHPRVIYSAVPPNLHVALGVFESLTRRPANAPWGC